jgi:hypothetical protein
MYGDDLKPADPQIDEVAFALERVCTYLMWIDEHRGSFEAARGSDPETAAAELLNLADATLQARRYGRYLAELIMSGRIVDASKTLPCQLRDTIERLGRDCD